jgi:transposase
MTKRKTYSGSFKARVISDLILGKKQLDELANDYQLHPNQIKNWKTLLFKRAHIVLDDRRHNKYGSLYY